MSNFYLDVIRNDPRYATTDRINDLGLLEPGTRAAIEAIIADARALGHDMIVLETYRSEARQRALFAEHETELRNVGVHGYGLACDLGLIVDGKYDPTGEQYVFLVNLAKKHGMISGIDWGEPNEPHTFRDWDHLQRIPLWRQPALFSGAWYPTAVYDPYIDIPAMA